MIPLLNETLKLTHVKISETIMQHLSQMSIKFDLYFPEDSQPGNLWILNPFPVDSAEEDMTLPLELENKVIELSEDSTLKLQRQELDFPAFWNKASKEYLLLSESEIKFLLASHHYLHMEIGLFHCNHNQVEVTKQSQNCCIECHYACKFVPYYSE